MAEVKRHIGELETAIAAEETTKISPPVAPRPPSSATALAPSSPPASAVEASVPQPTAISTTAERPAPKRRAWIGEWSWAPWSWWRAAWRWESPWACRALTIRRPHSAACRRTDATDSHTASPRGDLRVRRQHPQLQKEHDSCLTLTSLGAATNAGLVDISVILPAGTIPSPTPLVRTPGRARDTVELDFSSYVAGQIVILQVQALQSSSIPLVLAQDSMPIQLAAGCTAATLTLGSVAADLSVSSSTLQVAPPLYDFGNVLVGGMSASRVSSSPMSAPVPPSSARRSSFPRARSRSTTPAQE